METHKNHRRIYELSRKEFRREVQVRSGASFLMLFGCPKEREKGERGKEKKAGKELSERIYHIPGTAVTNGHKLA